MFYGTNFGVGKFIYHSVIPVTLGNIIGGAGMAVYVLWFMYGRDGTLATKAGQVYGGEKVAHGGGGSRGPGRSVDDDARNETGTPSDYHNGTRPRRRVSDIV
ncbi:uncharacterized protein LY79DRAFT_575530 [Colletotrichum navitas]|uniref:Formate/nitrite transporter n=1 Tax=Colletotrichum navitas TaxID=681940 RepID=A0AAD8QC29_9PEZI|nr:uncharacterized protein LY79DRAFT_575530 [Colletotrichum navitas]KAK1598947.1 hypothetical protein LY79DRAFT_575530 [Colletotrichum navitas]